ncbi:MAG: hypothetical protein DDT37_01895 [Firmicutes bacterium]|nr:hypothetical protein [candidate division NPL-UPA2 bacterium]
MNAKTFHVQFEDKGVNPLEHVINRVLKAFELTADFYSFIPEAGLALAILGAPANKIGEQAWCIVGARESYLAA